MHTKRSAEDRPPVTHTSLHSTHSQSLVHGRQPLRHHPSFLDGAQPAIGAEWGRESMPCPCPTCTPGKTIGPALQHHPAHANAACKWSREGAVPDTSYSFCGRMRQVDTRNFSPAPRGTPQTHPNRPTAPSRPPAPSRGTQLPAQPSSSSPRPLLLAERVARWLLLLSYAPWPVPTRGQGGSS